MEPIDPQAIILLKLAGTEQLLSQDLQAELKLSPQALYAELVSLLSIDYIQFTQAKEAYWALTEEGNSYANEGTPEYKLWQLTKEGQIPVAVASEKLGAPVYKVAVGNAIKKKIVEVKDGKIIRKQGDYEDTDRKRLIKIRENPKEVSKEDQKQLKQRKLIEEKHTTIYTIKKGKKYKQIKPKCATQLTSDMLANHSWKDVEFKGFNPQAKGSIAPQGHLHPVMKTREQFKQIFLEMGFEEMATDRYVENSFWNFDSLFQPQAHPARDAHDTFFIADPAKAVKSLITDEEYFLKVKDVHERGGYGSLGYDYKWQEEESLKNILRTHTTAISSQVLRTLAKEKPFKPRKFFSIDRVFRNESLDQTHLAEFHQVEGFVIDYDLGLHHLMGVLSEFYKKIGIKKLWFKPTYNPYTEPSLEVYGEHPVLKRKVEIGNSGIFRPEMLRPMGFPQNVSVIAWGLGLERPTMIQFGIKNIRELFGTSVSIHKVQQSGIYCL